MTSEKIMEIDNKILKETAYCRRNFECLKAHTEFFKINGKVERCLDGKVHIVKCNQIICHYKMSFGKYIICNCPTRKEIYKRQKQ